MFGKIIGAAAGAAAGNATKGMSGAKGAVVGTLAVAAVRRMGILGLVAAGTGAYLLKKKSDERQGKARMQVASRIATARRCIRLSRSQSR